MKFMFDGRVGMRQALRITSKHLVGLKGAKMCSRLRTFKRLVVCSYFVSEWGWPKPFYPFDWSEHRVGPTYTEMRP